MNRWAEARAAEGGLPWVAIAWTNWTGAGMGDVAGPAYRDLGLLTHDVATGLGLLDRALATGRAVVLPTRVDDACFSVPRLTGLEARTAGRGAVSPAAPAVAAASSAVDDPGELLGLARAGVRAALGQALRVPEDRIGDDAAFDEFGVDSILVMELIADLEHWLERKIPPGLPLEYPTVEALAAYLVSHYASELAAVRARRRETAPSATPAPAAAPVRATGNPLAPSAAAPTRPTARADARAYEPVAIIGMACHFPEATDLDAYWKNLREGRDCVRTVPPSRWSLEKHYAPEPCAGKSASRHGGFLDGIELFDPGYFEISEQDAPGVDPLIRQFLEVSAQCVRHAGYERQELSGRKVGVFVGSRVSNYGERVTRPTSRVFLGIGQNFIAAHVSQLFDLTGPSLVVDTACSSSLTSLHLAAKSLQSGECDMAIAGGVDILLDQEVYLRLSAAKVLSPDGRCFVFDERANGFVPGEGAGALLLKPLSRALADGDTIHAVVEASAVNNDGRTMGVTTPNPAAQKLVIEAALRAGAISPETIGYIEAHGTGTAIGDPIELKALTEVFRALGATSGGCGVGSVKANMGHLLSAAGVAGVIKVALAISRRELPPTLHCERPNPRFAFEASPFFPNRTLRTWEPRGGFLRAGVSGFGFGGTNAHVILGRGPVGRSERAPLSPIVFERRRYWLDRADEEPRVTTTDRPLGSIQFNP
jgi:3-oxoacyl-(acyl-carrier-protein) synthase/acyl carrier protein